MTVDWPRLTNRDLSEGVPRPGIALHPQTPVSLFTSRISKDGGRLAIKYSGTRNARVKLFDLSGRLIKSC